MGEIEIIPGSIELVKLTDEEYFSDKYKDYISNTRLGMINPDEGGSVEKFLSGFKEEYSASFELGSALHATLLQNEYYYISKFKKPGGKIGIFVEKVFEYRKNNPTMKISEAIQQASLDADYYSGKQVGNRIRLSMQSGISYYMYLLRNDALEREENSPKVPIYVSDSTYGKYTSCISKVNKNKKIVDLLAPVTHPDGWEAFSEYALLAKVRITIKDKVIVLKVKGKLDHFALDHNKRELMLNDLKTTSKSVKFFMGNNVKIWDGQRQVYQWFDGSFQKYRYYRQMAMYLWMLQCYVQQELNLKYKSKVNIIVVETIPNFESKIFSVGNEHITKGLQELKKLLTLVAELKIQNS